jgi:hypothetical protein
MHKLSGLGMLIGTFGFTVLLVSSIAYAQIEGALQYPPPSVGEDAQPPPPARMVPQTIPPRQIELGVSGPSQLPTNFGYRVRSRAGADPFSARPAPPPGAPPIPSPSADGN